MQTHNVAVVILAAGLGTRMKSGKAKVLHEILDQPMVAYVAETAGKVAGDNIIFIIGNQAEKVRQVVSDSCMQRLGFLPRFALQEEQLGTGHAVLCALPEIPACAEDVVILCGDVPLLTAATLSHFLTDHTKTGRDISLLAVQLDKPKGYGRVLMDENENVLGIVEEADATDEQRKIKTINTGVYCVKKQFLTEAVRKIRADNAQGEFYLTDIIEIGYREGKRIGSLIGNDPDEVLGVNTPQDLTLVENIMRHRLGKIS